jgi:hypothetical protein
MAEPLNIRPATPRSHAERHQARRCGCPRDHALDPPAHHREGASMQVRIVAASADAFGRVSQWEAPGVVFHRIASLAQARVALRADPGFDAILIAATGIARSGCVAATAALPRPYPRRAPQ